MKRLGLAATALLLLSDQAPAPDATGEGLVADGRARIRIEPCGPVLCGVVAWVKEPGPGEAPDPAGRDRGGAIGTKILLGMKPAAQNRWEGEIYNAENGKTYSGSISLTEANVLRIEGCVLGGLLCGGENWTRFKGPAIPPPRAGSPPATGQTRR